MTKHVTREGLREYITQRECEIAAERANHELLMSKSNVSFFYDDIALNRQRGELENLAKWFGITLRRGKRKTPKLKAP